MYEQFQYDEDEDEDEDGDPKCLWLHDDEGNCNPEHVAAFVCKLAQQFNLKGKWGFEWADTCSRPLLDSFGGGAIAIDLATGVVENLRTFEWLADHIQDQKGR